MILGKSDIHSTVSCYSYHSWQNNLETTSFLPVDSGHLTQNESVSSKSIKYSISEVDI